MADSYTRKTGWERVADFPAAGAPVSLPATLKGPAPETFPLPRAARFDDRPGVDPLTVARMLLAWGVTAVYRRVHMYACLLDRYIPPLEPAVDVAFRELTTGDLPAYLRFRRGMTAARLQARFERGDRCFTTWLGDEIVDAMWASTGVVHLPYLRCSLTLEAGQVYLYDAYTIPACRGHGLFMARNSFAARCLQREGFTECVGVIPAENYAALKVLARWVAAAPGDIRTVGTYAYLRLGILSRHWVRPSGGERLPALVAAPAA